MANFDLFRFNRYLEYPRRINPQVLKALTMAFGMWQNIHKQRAQLLVIKKKLNYLLFCYMRNRETHLRRIKEYSGEKIMLLLEYLRSPKQFQSVFRITLPSFLRIRKLLYDEEIKTSGWSHEIELIAFFFWLSSGTSFRVASRSLDMSLSSFSVICQDILSRFLNRIQRVIHFPMERISSICNGFQKVASEHIFGLVVGCLDTFHIQINTPKLDNKQFLNNSNYYSIQVQAVCDDKGAFLDVAVGFPGNMQKSQILQCTPLYVEKIIPPAGYVLLSGFGYPCLQQPICLIPPFENDEESPIEERFNICHSRVHSVLEKSVGQMFKRWKNVFKKPIAVTLPTATNLITACSVIHNICLEVNDIWTEEERVNFSINVEDTTLHDGQTSGEETRKKMAELLLSSDEVESITSDYSLYEI